MADINMPNRNVGMALDFSKILELQEIKKLYDEQQERHRGELDERDTEIARLREDLSRYLDRETADGGEIQQLREENERMGRQVQ